MFKHSVSKLEKEHFKASKDSYRLFHSPPTWSVDLRMMMMMTVIKPRPLSLPLPLPLIRPVFKSFSNLFKFCTKPQTVIETRQWTYKVSFVLPLCSFHFEMFLSKNPKRLLPLDTYKEKASEMTNVILIVTVSLRNNHLPTMGSESEEEQGSCFLLSSSYIQFILH